MERHDVKRHSYVQFFFTVFFLYGQVLQTFDANRSYANQCVCRVRPWKAFFIQPERDVSMEHIGEKDDREDNKEQLTRRLRRLRQERGRGEERVQPAGDSRRENWRQRCSQLGGGSQSWLKKRFDANHGCRLPG